MQNNSQAVTRRAFGAISLSAVSAMALAACGQGSPSAPGSSANSASGGANLTKITLGVLPITDVAPIYLGQKQGIFAKHGLELDIQIAQGGAAILPAVTTGEYVIGYSNVVSLLIAQDKGLPIKVVHNGSSSTNKAGADVTEVAAKADKGIASPKDLVGKKIAVNALNNFADITIRNAVKKDGGDPTKLSFVEIPYPQMPAAIDRGDVDAAWTTEPFRTQILEAGGKIVASPMTDMAQNFDSAFFFTSQQSLTDKADVITKFRAALDESFDYANANEAAFREIIQDYAKVTPELAKKVVMSKWNKKVNQDALNTLGAAAKEFGVISNEPNIAGLLAES
ncbi:ABC transporter substrate-binding protein [Neomicrococcus lactis]|uniref:ABC transporter substrate-binding protein n=1 Tax=Neomicrococcus lactis TaxID=732241 RepID=UPI0023002F0C|nr:ABC transporter substrate-binding protein [Neomicrococcus lactis]